MFEAFLTFQGLIPSPSLGCCWWIGSTKPPATRFRDGVSPCNAGKPFTYCLPENVSLKCWFSILLLILANYSCCYIQFRQNRISKLQSKYMICFRVKINASNWRLSLFLLRPSRMHWDFCLAVCGTCIDVDLLICVRFYDFFSGVLLL